MKTWVIIVLLGAAFGALVYQPTRTKIVAALPDKVTSLFDDDPSDTLPKDLVLSLTDDFDLGFSLKSLDGEPYGREELKDKVVIALVWNTDCGLQCLDTMRHIQKLAKKYAAQGVVAITINNDELSKGKTNAEVKQYAADNNIQLPVLLMDLPTGQTFWPNECKYGLAKQPFHEILVYDRNGAVRFRANQDYVRPVVQEVLAGWENYTDEKVKSGNYPPLKDQ